MFARLLGPLRHPRFNVVQASRKRVLSKLKAMRENRDDWKRIAEFRWTEIAKSQIRVGELADKLSKTDAKVVSYSKKNTQLEVLLQSEREEKRSIIETLDAKETELARHISDNMALRADVRRLQMEVEISNDKIAILEHGARFYDTQNQVLQKSVESMLATMSGHEHNGHRQSDPAEQNAT